MTCEICQFVDRRPYSVPTSLRWVADGIPLVTVRADCPECGWQQAINQTWGAWDQ